MDSLKEKDLSLENETELSLLRDISRRLELMEKREKRRRVKNWILAILIVAALAALAIVFTPKVQAFMQQYEAVTAKVQEVSEVLESLNVEKIQQAADFIGSVDYNKLMEFSAVLDSLETEKLKEQLESVTDMLDKLGELDMEKLVDGINTITEKIQPLLSFFKR